MFRLASLGLAVLVLACGERRPDAGAPAAADTSEPVVVAIHGLVLRAAPADTAGEAFEVAAGNPLRVREMRGGWLRLATWDDRVAWAPEAALVDLALWAHYQDALGGAPLSDLRPAYPLGDGRWGVEAPPPSPGVVTTGSLWIVGGEPLSANLAGVDEVPNSCGRPYRIGILAEAPGPARGGSPDLGRARIATTAAPGSTLQPLAAGPAEPDSAAQAAIRRLADTAGLEPAAWHALGDAALWVTLAAPDGARIAAVVVVAGEARLVVPPHPALGPPEALRPVLGFATAGDARPTILLVERPGAAGTRLEAYVARELDYRRFYQGYAWGC